MGAFLLGQPDAECARVEKRQAGRLCRVVGLLLAALGLLRPAFLLAQTSGASALVIYDVNDSRTQSLVSALEAEGIAVGLSEAPETAYDGTNPSPNGFSAVIHLNGATFSQDMPTAGQLALVDFVANGGGFIHAEWNGFELDTGGRLQSMTDLTLISRVSGADSEVITLTAPAGQESHVILANLPDPATFTSAHNVGPARTFAIDPATTVLEDQSGNAALVVREFGDGRVVGMHHTGNYTLANPLQDATLQQLYIDAVLWVSGVTDPPLPYPANSAVHLDGSDDYVVVADSAVLDFDAADDFTVEAWVRPWAAQTDLGADTNSVIEKWDGAGGYPYAIRYGNQSGARSGQVWGARYDGANYAEAVSSSTVADGTFHHVAFVKDGSALRLYVDGALESPPSTDTTSGATANAASFYIGQVGSGAGRLRGSVDDVRVWSVARTAEEIQNALYKTLLGSEVGLAGHWAFNDLTAADITANMNDGAAQNGAGISASAPVFTANSAPNPSSGLSAQVTEGDTAQISLTGADGDGDFLSFALGSATSDLGVALTLTDTDLTDNIATVSYTPVGVKGVDGFTFTVTDGLLTSSGTDVDLEVFLAANSAASLDGVDDYVLIPDHAAVDISAGGDFSLSLWAKTADASNAPRLVSKRESGGDTLGYEVYLDSGDGAARVLFDPGMGGATVGVVGSTPIADDAWHHVAFALSGASANLYVDGVLDGSTSDAGLAVGFASAADLLLGASLAVAGAELTGMVDEVRAWSSARSETQIQAVMEYTLTGSESDLVGYWTFDAGVVTDLTSNGNHGSLVNGAIVTASSKSFITNTVAPVAVDSSAAASEDTPVLIPLDATDADGNPLVFTADSILTQTANGRVVVDTDDSSPTYGQATYSPFLDVSGADSFTWYVTDGINASNTATVTITVSAADDTPTAAGLTALYSDGFASGGASTTVDPDITLGWSTSSLAASPNGQEFLGSDAAYGFGNETASLTLGSLPSHTEVFVAFDLYVIQAWEGHGAGGGPDLWTLLADGATTISASFSNVNDGAQSYPTDYDGGSPTNNGSGRGASAHNALGYLGHVEASQYPTGSPWEDVTYRVALTLPHTADSLTLDFAASGLEAIYDESWGIDNLSVSVNSEATNEDTPLTVTLTGADADNDALTYTVTGSPADGVVSGAAPVVTYTPSQDFNGEDTFSYTVTDGALTSAASTVTVSVAPVNDAPTSDTQFFTSLDATPITVTMSGDDVESDPLTFSLDDSGAVTYLTTSNGGIVESGIAQWASAVSAYSSERSASSWSASQALGIPTTFSYGDISTSWAPAAQNDGQHWIELGFTTPVYATGAVVRETYGSGFVTQIDVSGPSTGLTTVWTGADTSLAGAVSSFRVTWTQTAYLVDAMRVYVDTDLNQDTWEEIDAALLVGATDPSGPGVVVSYVPAADFSGIDSFGYFANDGQTDGPLATVRISVASPNTPPEAVAVSGSTNEDDTLVLTLSGADPGEATPVTFSLWDGSAAVDTLTTALGATVTLSDADENDSQAIATYVPPSESSGADSFIFFVTDGELQSAFETVDVTVNAVNDAPVFDTVADITVEEDSGTGTISITNVAAGGGADEAGQTITFSVTSFDSTIIPHPTVTGAGATRTLTYTPAADAAGAVTVLVAAVDDGASPNPNAPATPRTFTINVTARNDAPEFNAIADITIDEDAAVATFTITGVGPGGGADEAAQAIAFTATSSNTSVVPDPAVTGTGDTRTVTYQPAANANGVVTITVTATDDGASGVSDFNTATRAFDITVNAVNDAPTMDTVTGVSLDEDAGATQVTLTGVGVGGGTDEAAQSLTITASSSGPSLVPDPVITGSGDTRTMTFQSAADAVGGVLVTLTVTDDGPTSGPSDVNSVTQSFIVIVLAVNDAPEFDDVADIAVDEDAGPATVVITGVDPGGGADEGAQEVMFSAISSDEAVVPHPSIVVGADTATLTYAPAADATGTATVTLTATDSASAPPNFSTLIKTFDITVNPVNDAPTFDAVADITLAEDTPASASLTNVAPGGGDDEAAQVVTVTATSGDPSILADPVVAGSGATRTITFTPVADAVGAATITLLATDDGPAGAADAWSTSATFVVTVDAVNDPPTLATIADQTADEDSAAVTVDLGAVGVGGGADEAAQAVSVTAASADPALLPDPTVTETQGVYTLTFAPVPDANGATQITVTAEDDGAATDPDVNTTARSFTVTVNPVDDAPSFNTISDVTASEGSDPVSVLITGVTTGPDDEAGQGVVSLTAISDDETVVPHPAITGSGDTRTLTFQPEPDANGVAVVTVTLVDGGQGDAPHENAYAQAFEVTVVPVNDTATAIPTTATTAEDIPVTVTLTGADVDGDPLAFLLWDGRQGVTTDVSSFYGGSVSLLDPTPGDDQATATYTPPTDFNGDDTFSFVVNDGTLDSATATVTVTVTAVNDAPTATADAATTAEDTPLDVALAGADVDGDTLGALLWDGAQSGVGPFSTTAGGTVSVGQSTAHYIPPADFHGDDAFEFVVTDGALTSGPATVTLTVTAVNDAPVAADASGTTAEDTPTTFTVGGSDLDGDAVTVLLWDGVAAVSTDVVSAAGGVVAIGATAGDAASATYTPAPDYNGQDRFDFVVSDGQSVSAPVTVGLTVTAVNDAPEATAAAAQTDEDTVVTVSLTGTDIDGDPLTVLLWDGAQSTSSVASAAGGTAVVSATSGDVATATYTPPADFSGDDSFEFVVGDGAVESAPATVAITVAAVDDPPTATAPADAAVWENGSVTIALSGADVDSTALSFSLGDASAPFPTTQLTTATGGTVTLADADPLDAVATATYVPPSAFDGDDTFAFRVSDGTTESGPRDVAITVATLPRVSLADASVTEGNSGTTTLDFTLALSKAHANAVTVDYVTADGTALDTIDYDGLASATATIPPGELTASIQVSVAPDAVNEADESFALLLTGATDAVVQTAAATGTILDDDDITLAVGDVSVSEGAGFAEFVVSASGATEQAVTIDFATADGSAVAVDDYTAITLSAADFDPVAGELRVQAPITDDGTNEAVETFTASIANATGRGVTVGVASAMATIIDDDAATVAISDASIAEPDAGTAPAAITVSLAEASAQDITVGYSTSPGSAAAGADYTSASGVAIVVAGTLDVTILVDVIGDLTNEDDETATVTLDTVAGDGAVVTDAVATLTILDNDDIAVSISDATVQEGASATASFALSLSGDSEQTVTVTASVAGASATADADFQAPAPSTVSFTPGGSATTFDVTVLDDAIHEADETFTVTLSAPTGRGVSIADDTAVATIQDTDALTVSIADAAVTEGDATDTLLTFDVSLSGVSEQTITADFTVTGDADGGATSGVDFTMPDSTTLAFAPGETSAAASVTVLGDAVNEADESLTVTLTATNDARVTIGDAAAAGAILDNDDVTLSIADAEVDEGDATGGLLTLVVTLSAASEQTVTAQYSTADGTASAGADYTAIVAGPLTFAPGETQASAVISVAGDAVYETDETVAVTLDAPTGRGVSVLGAAATGTILNDDAPPTLTIADVSAVEGYDADVTFTVSLSGDTEEDVTVGYATTAGTASAVADYVHTSGTLTVAAGATSADIAVTLVDDAVAEPEEAFTLTLTAPVAATLAAASATCVVTDDDHPPLTVTPPTSAVEGADTGFSADVILPVSGVASAALYYREGGASTESVTALTQQVDTVWTATVPGAFVSTRGLLWRVQVVDDLGQTFAEPDGVGVAYLPVAGTVSLALASMTDAPSVWNAVAAPLNLDDPAMSATFDSGDGGFIAEWFAWRWNATAQRWEVAESLADDTPVATDGFDVGKGWFVAVVGDGADETRPVVGRSVDSSARYPLPIVAGWNLLANPYGFPVAWSDASVEVALGNISGSPSDLAGRVDNRLVYLDTATQSYVERLSDEESPYAVPPGQAWWFYSTEGGELLFDAAAVDGAGATVSAPGGAVSAPGAWRVLVAVTSDGGSDAAEAVITAGPPVRTLADVKLPRSPASVAPRVSLVGADAAGVTVEFARGRREAGDDIEWTVEVTNADGATLDILPVGVPADYELRLTDPRTGRSFDPRRETRLRLEGSGYDTRRFVLRATRRAAPETTRLLANYPNPFNPETWIPFELDAAADITIHIYDITGALVRSLDLGRREAGYYTERDVAGYWDGRNATGEPVVSGAYFYALRAGEAAESRATRRMVILK